MQIDGGSSIARKFAEVMTAVESVAKRGRNSFHGYDYATEADISEALRGELAKRQLAVVPEVTSIERLEMTTAKGNETGLFIVYMMVNVIDGETGETRRFEWAGTGEDPGDKGLYKAMTGGVKFWLLKTFLIPTGNDPEGDGATDERTAGGSSGGRPAAASRSTTSSGSSAGGQRSATEKQVKLMQGRADKAGLSAQAFADLLEAQVNTREVTQVPIRAVDNVLEAIAELS